MSRVRLVGVALFLLAGCAQQSQPDPHVGWPGAIPATNPAQNPERVLIGLRATHVNVCGGILDAHMAGLLVGKDFNKAKAVCLETDSLLDSADVLLEAGMVDAALAAGQKASERLETIQAK